MKTLSILLVLATLYSTSLTQTIYNALRSETIDSVDDALATLAEQQETTTIKAYKGTLLMKRAELLSSPGKKLSSFKEGHELLEEAIAEDPENAELRFLRLSIQENAPKILTYYGNIEEDKVMILAQYHNFNKELQAFVKDFAKTSEVISSKDLKK